MDLIKTYSFANLSNNRAQFDGSHHHQHSSQLLRMPNEIILIIAKYLSSGSACCFALTCKRLFTFPFISYNTHMKANDACFRRGFLPLLERDVGTHFYCHSCNRLHFIGKNWTPKNTSSLMKRDCYGEFKFLKGGKTLDQNLSLSYYDAHLVMDRHIYGSTHGLPLEALAVSYRSTEQSLDDIYSRNNMSWSETWTPRIIEGDLFLSGKFEAFYPYRFSMLCPDLYFPRKLCSHLDSSIYEYSSCFELAKSRASLTQKNTSTRHGSCQYCLMDWEVTAEWEPQDDGCRVTTTIYYQLGSCRSPLNQTWDSFVFRYRRKDPRTRTRARARIRKRVKRDPDAFESSHELLYPKEMTGVIKTRWEQGGDRGTNKDGEENKHRRDQDD